MFASKELTKQTEGSDRSYKPFGVNTQAVPVSLSEGRLTSSLRLQRAMGNQTVQARLQNRGPGIQRVCACGGNCASCSGKTEENPTIQTKLTVGPANDVYEQEADQVANQILRMPTPVGFPSPPHQQDHVPVQRHIHSNTTKDQNISLDNPLPYTNGNPLSMDTRQYMEPRFGTDFSHVRVHSGQSAQDTATQIHAKAFTHGSDIWLGKGATESDKRLMAHELTHVIQQQPNQHSPRRNQKKTQSTQVSNTSSIGTASGQNVQRLPFGISLPSGLRFLDSTEQGMATGVYGGSLNYNKILLSNGVGGGGRPFTTYVPSPIPGISAGTVINIGPSAYNTPGSNRNLLIHELAHSWQSQHHPNPAQFMVNSIESQAAAALAGASAYCYVPGKYFGFYGAEQIAEQVEDGESAIISEVASASPGMPHAGNILSLTVPRWETRGDPGVKC